MNYQQFCYDINTNQHYLLKNEKRTNCNRMGQECKYFIPYGTGMFDFEKRMIYSAKSGKTHMIPPRPRCFIDETAISNPCSYSGLNKIDGYAQFPRPLSTRTGSLILSNRTITNFHHNSKAYSGFLSQRNIDTSQPTIRSPKQNTPNSSIMLQNIAALPSKKMVKGTRIKESYMGLMKDTFTGFNNLDNFPEVITKTLRMRNNDELAAVTERSKTKTFSDIQSNIEREQKGIMGYQPPPEKRIPSKIQGLYSIVIPAETDLFAKAKKRREMINPRATEEELRQENLDIKLLEKRKVQRAIKYKVMMSIARKKEIGRAHV